MATHRVTLTEAESPGPFDIYYRLASSLTFTLLLSNVQDTPFSNGLCVTFPNGTRDVKVINKFNNSNVEVIYTIN